MRASLSDETPPKSKAAKNAAIAAAVLLAPGGFILGGLLIARAVRKRREAKGESEKDQSGL